MLLLQKEYHCYHSARLEAAVEAMEKSGVEEWRGVIPSRLCLDLLNSELKAHLEGLDRLSSS